MTNARGKLIVIEGTDGSGKATQTKLLVERLKRIGCPTGTLSFPQHGERSAELVDAYLNGEFGEANSVNPYVASTFFAIDRFVAAPVIRKLLDDGMVMILDRYVGSNGAHQGGKISDDAERGTFLSWLYDLEFKKFAIPKPDLVLILHLPAEMNLVSKKQDRLYIAGKKTHDGHESSMEHLKNAEAAYLWLAEKFPEEYRIVPCVESGKILAPEEVHARVWKVLEPIISERS